MFEFASKTAGPLNLTKSVSSAVPSIVSMNTAAFFYVGSLLRSTLRKPTVSLASTSVPTKEVVCSAWVDVVPWHQLDADLLVLSVGGGQQEHQPHQVTRPGEQN